MGTWHSNYSDYLKFYHLGVIRPFVDRFIRSFYDHMPVFVPVRVFIKGIDSRACVYSATSTNPTH